MRFFRTKIVSLGILAWAAALPVVAQINGGNAGRGPSLENPLRFPTIEKFIEGVLQAMIMIAIPIIVAFIVYAGFKYIFAQGNHGEIKKAHENFTYIIIGTILVLGAWVLATLIGGTVSQLLR